MKQLLSVFTLFLLSITNPLQAQVINLPVPVQDIPPISPYLPDLTNYSPDLNNRNYIRTYIPSQPTTSAAAISMTQQATLPCIVNTRYFDGLGRPLQDVFRSGVDNTFNSDIVSVHTYDEVGRESSHYLPFTVADQNSFTHGRLKISPRDLLSTQYDNLYTHEHPYSKDVFDNSSRNLITNSYEPGAAWVGNQLGKDIACRADNDAEDVRIWTINAAPGSLPQSATKYPSGTLNVTEITDEDGHQVLEYKNLSGQVVLRKTFIIDNPTSAHAGYNCTYYVYDDMGQMRYIISPQAVSFAMANGWDLTSLTELCYRYEYDERGRMIERQVPGKHEEYMVYDNRDRLVLFQDGNLNNEINKWAFTYYDALNRPLQTGIFTAPSSTRQSLATALAAYNPSLSSSSVLYYLNDNSFYNIYMSTLSDGIVYTTNYYDDYSHAPGVSFNSTYNSQLTGLAGYAVLPSASALTRGMLTSTSVKVMDPANPNLFINTTSYYDDKGQLVQQQSNNFLGGSEVQTVQYDFQGSVASTVHFHSNPNCTDNRYQATTLVNRYLKNYITGAVKNEALSINGAGFRDIYSISYDALGRVYNKKLGAAANNIYTYNIQGWLKGINAVNLNNTASHDFFHEQISYNDGFTNQLFNGNISGIIWRGYGSTSLKKAYGYSYDMLSRITRADFNQDDFFNDIWNNINTDYSVSNIDYDNNGNLLHMDQRGPGIVSGYPVPVSMDELTYRYAPYSNKLLAVTDNSTATSLAPDFKDGSNMGGTDDYDYDNNGNLTYDKNKEIQNAISYSYLNKPVKVDLAGKGSVEYLYDALGNKLRKTTEDVVAATKIVTDYVGPFAYEDNKPIYLLHSEGRCRPDPANTGTTQLWLYDYFMKDHVGNVRSVINVKETIDPPMMYEAGLEVAVAHLEGLMFSHLDEVRGPKPGATTPADVKAAELDGSNTDKQIGTALMMRVMPGDKFMVSAESWYEEVNNQTPVDGEQMVSSLIGALTGGGTYSGVPLSELPENVQTIQNAFGNPDFVGAYDALTNQNFDQQKPAAFLNYVVFDENYHMEEGSGAIQMGGAAGTWHVDEAPSEIEIGKPGYLAIWTSNKGTGKAYYDKIALTFYRGSVIEESHYYPFGLTLSSKSASPFERNNHKLTTKELQEDLGLNWYDFGPRDFDMQTGRWIGQDAHGESYPGWSPYSYNFNNPARFTDPTGMDPNTDLYSHETGNYLGTIKDNLPDAALIVKMDPSQEGVATKAINKLNNQSEQTRNATSGFLRTKGESYDTKSFSKFYNDNGAKTPATDIGVESLVGSTDFKFNGKSIVPYAEVNGNLILKNGIVTTGINTRSVGNMTVSWPQDLPNETGKVSSIHTHPVSEDGHFSSQFKLQFGSMTGPGGDFTPGVSGINGRGDYKSVSPYEKYRRVVVDNKNIYLYNSNLSQTITIKR